MCGELDVLPEKSFKNATMSGGETEVHEKNHILGEEPVPKDVAGKQSRRQIGDERGKAEGSGRSALEKKPSAAPCEEFRSREGGKDAMRPNLP